MRFATMALAMILAAAPAVAASDDPIYDMDVYAMWVVAGRNCQGLYFNDGTLVQKMAALAGQMHWSQDKAKVETDGRIRQNIKDYDDSPQTFCIVARQFVDQYGESALKDQGILF